MKYTIQANADVTKEINIEADTPEEALKAAFEQFAKAIKMDVKLRPEWVEESDYCERHGQLSFEVIGYCDSCKNGILSSRRGDGHKLHPEWPWSYTYRGNEHNPELLCYPCAEPPLKQLAAQAE